MILYSAWIELEYLREYRTHNRGGEVIGSALDKSSLGCPANRATGGSNNDSFGHNPFLSFFTTEK